MSHRQNIARIKAVYFALEELASEVVFVGGATVSLYSTRPEIETRPTDDVDIIQGIIVDVMPTSEAILGFSNRWYSIAFAKSISVPLEEDLSIKIFSAPYFLASKLEAFVDRGKNDGRFSSDFEDIVHVLNNRNSIWGEIRDADLVVKKYLKEEFAKLLAQKYIDEWISVHLEHSEQRRVGFIIGNMSEIVET